MKITVLGCGLVGKPMVKDLAKDLDAEFVVYDVNTSAINDLTSIKNVRLVQKDLSDLSELKESIKGSRLVLNALPGFLGYNASKAVIESGNDLVDISFFPESPDELEALAIENDVTAIIDCGVAPGMSYILAAYAHYQLEHTDKIRIYVGGLPKIRTKPFEYKAVFSPVDVIEEYTRPARYIKDGKVVVMPALSEPELMNFNNIGTLEAFNTDGLRSMIKNINCSDMIEKTLRYPGHIEKIQFLKDCGFFSENKILTSVGEVSALEFTSKVLIPLWKLNENEEDITIMQVITEGRKEGKKLRYTYNLFDEYNKNDGVHSMARTTGYTATMAVRMLLKGIFSEKGLIYPELIGKHSNCVSFLLEGLKSRGVVYHEQIETINES